MPFSAGARTWRDLNGNGVMDPYEDPHRSAEERVDDLVGRLCLPLLGSPATAHPSPRG